MLGEPEANSLILHCWRAQWDAQIFNPSACLHKGLFDFRQCGDVWFLIGNKKDLLWVNVLLNQRGATDSQSYPGFWKCFPWDYMRSEISVHWVSRQPEPMLFKPSSTYTSDIFGLSAPFLSFLPFLLYQTSHFSPPFWTCLQTYCPPDIPYKIHKREDMRIPHIPNGIYAAINISNSYYSPYFIFHPELVDYVWW